MSVFDKESPYRNYVLGGILVLGLLMGAFLTEFVASVFSEDDSAISMVDTTNLFIEACLNENIYEAERLFLGSGYKNACAFVESVEVPLARDMRYVLPTSPEELSKADVSLFQVPKITTHPQLEIVWEWEVLPNTYEHIKFSATWFSDEEAWKITGVSIAG